MPYEKYFRNKPDYTFRRSKLRRNQTKAEQVFWREAEAKKLGVRFRRQFQIGTYIVDFYCDTLKLIIELDGPIHTDQSYYDSKRQQWLEEEGYFVIRYLNDEILFERDLVMMHLQSIIENRKAVLLP